MLTLLVLMYWHIAICAFVNMLTLPWARIFVDSFHIYINIFIDPNHILIHFY